MIRRLMTRFGLAVSVAIVVLSLTAGAALAGEITGTGKSLEPLDGDSICAYSGLNDDPNGIDPDNGPPGRTQSFGQDVKLGIFEPSELKAGVPSPGFACNPNNGFGG
jgi:hypothetical protein